MHSNIENINDSANTQYIFCYLCNAIIIICRKYSENLVITHMVADLKVIAKQAWYVISLPYTCFSAWYDDLTSGALSTKRKPFDLAMSP